MENSENIQSVQESVYNSKQINNYLLETARWGKFLAIVGYVGMGILVLLALGVMVGGTIASKFANTSFPIALLGILYLFFAVVYYFPVTYLYRFSTRIKEGINSQAEQTVTKGFENLKSLFKFMGIFTIVILSIYGLMLLLIVPLSIFFAAKGF